MDKQTHTPGPWEARQAIVVCPRTGTVLADVRSPKGHDPNDAERRANARLIASSPDTLAACEAALPLMVLAGSEAMKIGDKEAVTHYHDTCDLLSRVISLATNGKG